MKAQVTIPSELFTELIYLSNMSKNYFYHRLDHVRAKLRHDPEDTFWKTCAEKWEREFKNANVIPEKALSEAKYSLQES